MNIFFKTFFLLFLLFLVSFPTIAQNSLDKTTFSNAIAFAVSWRSDYFLIADLTSEDALKYNSISAQIQYYEENFGQTTLGELSEPYVIYKNLGGGSFYLDGIYYDSGKKRYKKPIGNIEADILIVRNNYAVLYNEDGNKREDGHFTLDKEGRFSERQGRHPSDTEIQYTPDGKIKYYTVDRHKHLFKFKDGNVSEEEHIDPSNDVAHIKYDIVEVNDSRHWTVIDLSVMVDGEKYNYARILRTFN